MRVLSASDILYVREAGQRKHAVDRALLLLALGLPAFSPAALSALTVGQRNGQLVLLRQKTLGSAAMCFAQCPRCDEKLEFTLDLPTMLPAGMVEFDEPGECPEHQYTLSLATCTLTFRLPTSTDLVALAQIGDVQAGSRFLVERCVVKAVRNAQEVSVAELPAGVLQALAEAVIQHDPLAEIELVLTCPACQHVWTTLFDIVSFFWMELETLAKRLLRDVHTIASAYGWRESDILALSAARRQFYLELIRS